MSKDIDVHSFSFDVFSSLFLPSLIKRTRNREQCLATGNTKTIGIRKEKEKGKKRRRRKEGRKRKGERKSLSLPFSSFYEKFLFPFKFVETIPRRFPRHGENYSVAALSLFLTRRKLFFFSFFCGFGGNDFTRTYCQDSKRDDG